MALLAPLAPLAPLALLLDALRGGLFFGVGVVEPLDHGVARAVHDDRALLHDDDAVADLKHLRPVGHHHQRLVARPFGQHLQRPDFMGGVQTRGGLVKQHHLRLAQHEPRDRDHLLLAARQAHAVFAQGHVQAALAVLHELVQAQGVNHVEQLVVLGEARPAGDVEVLAQGAQKQPRVLLQQGDAVAQVIGVDLANVDVVQRDVAEVGLVQAGQKLEQRAFARSDRADDRHLFLRADHQIHLVDDRGHLGVVLEAHVARRQLPRDLFQGDVVLVVVALDLSLQNRVHALQGHARLLKARGQARDLRQRRQGAAGKDHRRDQGAHGDAVGWVLGVDQEGAHQDQEDGVELLAHHREVDDEVGQILDLDLHHGGHGRVVVPLLLRPHLRVVGFERFDAFDRLDRQALALRPLLHALLDEKRQLGLHRHAHHDDGGDDHHRHEGELAAHDADDRDEHDGEGQIHQSQQAGRRHEFAHGLEIAQVVRVGSRRRGPRRQVQRHDAAKQGGGDHQVGLFACDVEQVGADHLGHELEADGQHHADGQGRQGLVGLVGDHAVVHVHDVKRADQGQEVDQERRADHLVVVAAVAPDDLPKPRFGHVVFGQLRAHVLLRPALDEPHEAQINLRELLLGELVLQPVGLP